MYDEEGQGISVELLHHLPLQKVKVSPKIQKVGCRDAQRRQPLAVTVLCDGGSGVQGGSRSGGERRGLRRLNCPGQARLTDGQS